MNKSKNNKYGFTLIELLAVIVVLAIVMLIAVTAIMPQLAEARENVFAIEANSAAEAANTYFLNNSINPKDTADKNEILPTDDKGQRCVTIEKLASSGNLKIDTAEYYGGVKVTKSGNNYVYSVWLTNQKLMIKNGNGNSSGTDVNDYKGADFGKGKDFWTTTGENAMKTDCSDFPA